MPRTRPATRRALFLSLVSAVALLSTGPAVLAQDHADNPRIFLGEIVPNPELLVEVAATLWGKIYLEENVHEGARVRKDQPLARTVLELPANERLPLYDRTIDIDQYVEIAKEKARLALEDHRRAKEIAKLNPDFQAEAIRRKKIYENARKELQVVNAQKRRQNRVVKIRDPRTVILKSPIDGYVDEIYFIPGELNPTDDFRVLMTILDLSTVWVRANVYEKDLALLKNGPDARIQLEAFPEETFRGRFLTLGSELDPVSRTLPVYYEVRNPEHKLKVGLPVILQVGPKEG